MNAESRQPDALIDHARHLVYRFLSLAFSDPKSVRWQRLRDSAFYQQANEASELLKHESAAAECSVAPGERPAEQLNLNSLRMLWLEPGFDAEAEYQSTFGLMMSKKFPPYESEYCPQTFSVYRAHTIADVAGFYKAFGLEPSRDMPERHDHIALELEFMSWLILKEAHARQTSRDGQANENARVCAEAARKFFREHIVWWMPAFAHALRQRAASRFYLALADILSAFIHVERALTGVEAPTELVAPQQTDDTSAECEHSCAISDGVQ